jgi:hypothetical protein
MADLEDAIVYGSMGAAVVCVAVGVVARARCTSHEVTGSKGRIVPCHATLTMLTLGIACIALVLPVLGHLLVRPSPGFVWVGAAVTTLIYLAARSMRSNYYTVDWDEQGIQGPSGFSFRPSRASRTTAAWSALTSAKNDSDAWILRTSAGSRIRFDGTYCGSEHLVTALMRRRPDLVSS